MIFLRDTMHVQSISHWAPANIGPYSQAIKIGNVIHLAGQIALVPGSMVIVKGGIKQQCRLALRNVDRILSAIDAKTNVRSVVQVNEKNTNSTYIKFVHYKINFLGGVLRYKYTITATCKKIMGRKNKQCYC